MLGPEFDSENGQTKKQTNREEKNPHNNNKLQMSGSYKVIKVIKKKKDVCDGYSWMWN